MVGPERSRRQAERFRKLAEAVYGLAGEASHFADKRLSLVLQAMEFEARAVDAERGKTIPDFVGWFDTYRSRAVGCEWAAEIAKRNETRELFLDLAAQWHALAERAARIDAFARQFFRIVEEQHHS